MDIMFELKLPDNMNLMMKMNFAVSRIKDKKQQMEEQIAQY